jgi:predicted metalloprotease
VIAHEVGHHIQHLIGATEEMERAYGGNQSGADSASVRIELQADCFAGVWAYHAKERNIVEPGDVDEALNAATAIGDDKLQEQGQGYVVPDSFTHGTSAQRVRWFKRGMEKGDVNACDTLKAKTL